jgi:putative ATP-dependent DNA ligase
MGSSKAAVAGHSYEDLDYRRYTKDTGEYSRGTVLLPEEDGGERTISGFPHVPRTYRLYPGVHRNFPGSSFYVEEKIDGYNARILSHRGRLLAFSKGGFVCPFTTEWTSIWSEQSDLKGYFQDHPEHVLCGEVIGDNPYNNQRDELVGPGLHLRIFDIRDEHSRFLPVEERYDLCDEYELPGVPRLGIYSEDQLEELAELLRDLNAREREGVVLKRKDSSSPLKYVTPAGELEDIVDNLRIAFDVGFAFFLHRILRSVAAARELGLPEDQFSYDLGEAFIEGYEPIEDPEEVTDHYRIFVQRRETWEALKERIGSAVEIRTGEIEEEELHGRRMLRVEFDRIYRRSTRRFRRIARGRPHVD